MRVDSFVFLSSMYEAIEELEDTEVKLEIYQGICQYALQHRTPDLKNPVSRAMMKIFYPLLDSQYQKRMANTENGKKGGRPKGKTAKLAETEDKAELTQTNPNETETKPGQSLMLNVKCEMDNGKCEMDKKRFTPPSVEEVKAYCLERGNGIDPESFVNFYASKGWLVGKNKMKDWKACVRTWEGRNSNKPADIEPVYSVATNLEYDEERFNELMRRRQSQQ